MTEEGIKSAKILNPYGNEELADLICGLAERVRRGEIVYVTGAYLAHDGKASFLNGGSPGDGSDYLKILGAMDMLKRDVRKEITGLMTPVCEDSE